MITYEDIRLEIIRTGTISEEGAEYLLEQGRIKAARYGISSLDREDAVQDALVALFDKIHSGQYDTQYSPATYFFNTVEGNCLSINRKNKNRAALSLSVTDDDDDMAEIVPSVMDAPPDESVELLLKLRDALKNGDQWATLKMLLDGKKGIEIAEALGVTPQMASLHVLAVREIAERVAKDFMGDE